MYSLAQKTILLNRLYYTDLGKGGDQTWPAPFLTSNQSVPGTHMLSTNVYLGYCCCGWSAEYIPPAGVRGGVLRGDQSTESQALLFHPLLFFELNSYTNIQNKINERGSQDKGFKGCELPTCLLQLGTTGALNTIPTTGEFFRIAS